MDKALALALMEYEDHPEEDFFEAVTEEEYTGKSRWSLFYRQIWRDIRNNTFWAIDFERGATEQQYVELEDSIEVSRVYPKTKVVTTTVYERKPD